MELSAVVFTQDRVTYFHSTQWSECSWYR